MTLIDYDLRHIWTPPVRRRNNRQLTEAQQRYPLYTVGELGMFPPIEWLVPNYLAANELTNLWGKGGVYKSFLAVAWAADVAQHAPVVYIAAEGKSGMRQRVLAWMKHHGARRLPNFLVMPDTLNLHREADVTVWIEAVRAYVGELQPELIVVDTLARNFVGGSESDPRDMGLFVDGAERIRKEFRTAVLVIHHSTKGGQAERGTEALRNASFAMYEVTRAGGVDRTAVVKCDRMKEAEEPPTVRVPLVQVPLPEVEPGAGSLVAEWSLSPPNSPPPGGTRGGGRGGETAAQFSPPERKLLRHLMEAKQEASSDAVARLLGVQRKNLSRRVKRLLESGFISVAGGTRDRRYAITEQGRAAL